MWSKGKGVFPCARPMEMVSLRSQCDDPEGKGDRPFLGGWEATMAGKRVGGGVKKGLTGGGFRVLIQSFLNK